MQVSLDSASLLVTIGIIPLMQMALRNTPYLDPNLEPQALTQMSMVIPSLMGKSYPNSRSLASTPKAILILIHNDPAQSSTHDVLVKSSINLRVHFFDIFVRQLFVHIRQCLQQIGCCLILNNVEHHVSRQCQLNQP